jgi:hypothetical protein
MGGRVSAAMSQPRALACEQGLACAHVSALLSVLLPTHSLYLHQLPGKLAEESGLVSKLVGVARVVLLKNGPLFLLEFLLGTVPLFTVSAVYS